MTKLEELRDTVDAAVLAYNAREAAKAVYADARDTYDAEYDATYEELISARTAADVAFNAARAAAVLTYKAAYAAYLDVWDDALSPELKKHKDNTHGMATD